MTDLVGDSVLQLLKNGDHSKNPKLEEEVKNEILELKRKLFESPKLWDLWLVVEGLAPSGLPLTVGQVDFRYYDQPAVNDLSGKLFNLVAKAESQSKPSTKNQIEMDISKLNECAVASLHVAAVDFNAATELARHRLQITIDAINFYASRDRLGGWVFLPGDTSPQSHLVIGICEDDRFIIGYRSSGPRRKIPLDQLSKRPGFARVSAMLASNNPSDLEERILASLRWAGRAQVEARPEERFLLYAISLESLILGTNVKTEIMHQLAVRCAHLGGGPTLDERRRVIEQITSLYNVRSRIVHSGNFEVSRADLELISEYAIWSLFVVIDTEPFKSMTTVRDFDLWFESQLLAGGGLPGSAPSNRASREADGPGSSS